MAAARPERPAVRDQPVPGGDRGRPRPGPGPRPLSSLAARAALLGLALGPGQVRSLERYIELIAAGNEAAGLTAVEDPDEVRERHFLDSLSVAAAAGPERLARSEVVDVGSGAGFPGVPVAIAIGACRVTALEASARKVAFLERVRAELGLENLSVVRGRAESVGRDPAHRERYDIALARAVAPLATLAELCMPLCRVGGALIAHKGRGAAGELVAARRALSETGGGRPSVVEVDPAVVGPGRDARLVVVPKIAPTPGRFPRREGVPSRRPL